MQISFTVTAKLISAFVFTTRIVQSLYFLNPKFQASSYLLWLYSLVCIGPGRKPQRPVFSQRGSYWSTTNPDNISKETEEVEHSVTVHLFHVETIAQQDRASSHPSITSSHPIIGLLQQLVPVTIITVASSPLGAGTTIAGLLERSKQYTEDLT